VERVSFSSRRARSWRWSVSPLGQDGDRLSTNAGHRKRAAERGDFLAKKDVLKMSPQELHELRGRDIAVIFQDR